MNRLNVLNRINRLNGPPKQGGISWSTYWTQQYQDVLTYMTAQSITHPSNDDKLIQARLVKELVDGGYWAKAEFIDLFSTPAGMSLINWKAPGTYNPSVVNSAVFEAYKGYTGNNAAARYLKLNFIPSINAAAITPTNITLMFGVGTDVNEARSDVGVYDGSTSLRAYSRDSNNMACWLNSDGATNISNASAIGHYGFSRNGTSSTNRNKNNIKGSFVQLNTGENLLTKEMYACGYNNNGTAVANNKQLRYVMLFTYLEQYEMTDIMRIVDEYLLSYAANLITSQIPYVIESTKAVLPITTYVESNDEVIHNSVVNIGSTWNGYRYWMANTPYPSLLGSPSNYENPSIWASNDGSTWVVPAGLTNPIDTIPAGGFNCDPELYYENGTLYCFYCGNTVGPVKFLKVRKSTDGITWTDVTTIQTGVDFVSPAIIKIGATYYLYCVKGSAGAYAVKRLSAATIMGPYENEEAITVTGLGSTTPWHIGISKINDTYWLWVNGEDGAIYGASSSDGETFTVYNSTSIIAATPQATYRPSLMTLANGKMMLYYCGYSGSPSSWKQYMSEIKIINK